MSYDLYLDDERPLPKPSPRSRQRNWVLARTQFEAIRTIKEKGLPRFLSVDYYLGYQPRDREGGLHFINWFLIWCRANGNPYFDFACHSSNFEGIQKIERLVFDYWAEIE